MTPTNYTGQTAGIYPRVSTEKQAGEDSTSLSVQASNCRTYAASLGMVIDEVCVRHEAHTATETDRPELTRLLKDMIARQVPNLIIDKADRLTREGALAAAIFLDRFIEAGITLHVASEHLTITDEDDVMHFLMLAWMGKKENVQRTARVQENRRARAQERGRYVRGNRPPFGWKYEVTETDSLGRPTNWKLVHDDETYPIRRRILSLRTSGMSYYAIATLLTAEHVLTPNARAKQRNAGNAWHPKVIRDICLDPRNVGEVASYRSSYVWAPPDNKHPKRWKRKIRLPEEQHIKFAPGKVEPIVTSATEAQALTLHRDNATPVRFRSPSPLAEYALLHGGMARCAMEVPSGVCGGTLRVRVRRYPSGTTTLLYICRKHELQPSQCPGLNVRAVDLDCLVYAKVRAIVQEPGKLKALAEAQIAQDLSDDPAGELARLRRMRKKFAERRTNLVDAIADAPNATVRATLMSALATLQEEIEDADRHVSECEAIARDYERRRAILADVDVQAEHYAGILECHDPRDLEDVPMLHDIFCFLGVRVHVKRLDTGALEIRAGLNLGRGVTVPWFKTPRPNEMQVVVDAETGQQVLDGGVPTLRSPAATQIPPL